MKKQRQPPLIQIDRTNLPIALSTLAQIADRDNPGIQSTIAKFRDSDAHLLLTILPTTRDRSLALMAYELNGTIHCQFAGEPYPDGFTPQDARIHANVIAEQASQHIESPDERLTPAAQSALETAQHIIQLTNAGLLHTPLELVPDLLHSLESAGADRHTIHTVIRLIAGGQTELHFAIAETAQRPAPAHLKAGSRHPNSSPPHASSSTDHQLPDHARRRLRHSAPAGPTL